LYQNSRPTTVHFRKAHPQQVKQNSAEEKNVTANIIFNLAHLGLSIEDTKSFDLETYFSIVELEKNVINGNKYSKRATQKDIDSFYL
jgi:hypothetical protein